MQKILLSICFILTVFVFTLKAQNSLSIDFVFTANHTCSYSALDSVLVENLTQGGDTVLYWNDTVLTFSFTNISTISVDESDFWVSQNYPNPFKNQTDIDIFVNKSDEFLISVYDLVGREVANYKSVLEFGMHNFTFNAGNSKSYILTIKSGKEIRHIQMVQLSQIGFAPSIVYNGVVSSNEPDIIAKSLKTVFPYFIGDELRFTCYVSGDYLSIIDSPEHGELYFFDIANSLPDQPSIISGNTIVCENSTEVTYSVDIIENVDYLWSVPPEWEILSGQGTNSITVNAESSGILSVLTTNNCGDSPERSLEVYFSNVSVSATSISGDTEICAGTEAVLNVIGGELGTDAEWVWYSDLCGENEIGTGSAITVSPIETSSYFVRAEGLCNITSCVQVTIDVNATPDATITHPGVFCNTDSPVELNSATEGGVWSGDGITDVNLGTFDPAIAGEGSHIITYLVTENECTNTDQITIQVFETPDATISEQDDLCDNDSEVVLTAASTGGVWSGSGITDANNGIFDPAIAGEGSHIITYQVSENECTSSDQITIQVFETPDATISQPGEFCNNDSPFELNAATDGGIWSGDGITDANAGTFDPSIAGEGSHIVTYNVNIGICSDYDNITINVNSIPQSPTIGNHVISETQIVWNWSTSSGANGYKYNTENNYETATNNGNNNSYTQEGLDCNTEYTLYVWAYNDCGSSSTLVMTAETEDCSSEFICGEDFTDSRDDQSYTTLQIGDQCWMTENLAYLPVVHDNLQFYNAGENSQPGFGVYDYDGSDTNEAIATTSYNDFGVLYNWWAAMDGSTSSDTNPSGIQGICPDGWHLPSDAEWKQLEMHLGMTQEQADDTGWRGTNEGSKLAGGYDFWASGNLRNNAEFDSSGFSALPGGNRSSYGVYNLMSSNGNWWSSTETTATKAWRRNINNDNSSVVRFDNVKKNGYSIRCLR